MAAGLSSELIIQKDMKKRIGTMMYVLMGLCLAATLSAQHVYRTTGFSLEINGEGQVVGISDMNNQVNYVPNGNPGYLVRIRSNGKDLAEKPFLPQLRRRG
jgi:hypothetical protein